MGFIDFLVEKVISWIDQLFGLFGVYSKNYSQFFMYALIFFFLSKLLKIKINANLGK